MKEPKSVPLAYCILEIAVNNSYYQSDENITKVMKISTMATSITPESVTIYVKLRKEFISQTLISQQWIFFFCVN